MTDGGRFANVDFGTSQSLKRMARTIVRKRAEIMGEIIELLADKGEHKAADIIREVVRSEAKEIE